MKQHTKTTKNIILGILGLGLSMNIFAQHDADAIHYQRIDHLLGYGINFSSFLEQGKINYTPVPTKQPLNLDEDLIPNPTVSMEFPAQMELFSLLPDLSYLQALMHNPQDMGEISMTPVAGLYQIVIANDVYYLSRDGRYLFEGNLLDLSTRENLSDHRRNQMRTQLLADLTTKDVIAFAPKKARHQVTVFIDVDCPYCRVVYDNAAQYNELGIEMHFAPFPRNGVNSVAHAQLSAVWCAADRKLAMRQANEGLVLSAPTCQESIKKPHLIGMKMGVNATPTFVLENGSLIGGYVAPQNLVRLLENQ